MANRLLEARNIRALLKLTRLTVVPHRDDVERVHFADDCWRMSDEHTLAGAIPQPGGDYALRRMMQMNLRLIDTDNRRRPMGHAKKREH